MMARLMLIAALSSSWASGQVTVDFTATPTSGTNPLEVSFNGTVTGAEPINWLWLFGDGGSASGPSVIHTYTEPGSFDVELRVSVIDGGIVTYSEMKPGFIDVAGVALDPDFTWTPTGGTNPVVVAFTDTSTDATPTAWLWNLGDGTTSTLQHPDHEYDTPGTYDVSLTVFFGTQEATLVETSAVTVQPAAIVPDFTADVVTGVNPLTVTFSDTSTGPIDSWVWYFGTGISFEQNPTFTYDTPGDFDVRLIVYNGGQSELITKEDFISVLPLPFDVDFTASTTQGFNPLTVTFTDTTTGGPVDAWLWEFDGPIVTTTSTEEQPTHAFNAPGAHWVKLTVFSGGQAATEVKLDYITVDPIVLLPEFEVDVTEGQSPFEVQFTDASVGPVGFWSWNFGDGTSSNEPNPTKVYATPGTFDVSLSVRFGWQWETIVKADLITVEPADIVAKLEAVPTTGVYPLEVSFSNTSTAPELATVRWFFGDGQQTTEASPVHVYEDPGVYSVVMVVELGEQEEMLTIEGLIEVFDMPTCEETSKAVDDEAIVGGDFGELLAADNGLAVTWSRGARELTIIDVASTDVVNEISFHGDIEELDFDDGVIALGLPGGDLDGRVVLIDAATGDVLATLNPPPDADRMTFGSAVSMDGGLIIVGAPGGVASLFDVTNPSSPLLRSMPAPAGSTVPPQFGLDVVIKGDRALISSDDSIPEFIFRDVRAFDVGDPSAPEQLWTASFAGPSAGEFGDVLAIADDIAAVGLFGSVRTYDLETGTLLETITGPDSAALPSLFGSRLDADGTRLLVGAWRDGGEFELPGAAYLYDLESSELSTKFVASDGDDRDALGFSVALSGDSVILGAYHDDDLATNSGALYRFEIASTSWTDLGGALAGELGTPRLTGYGTLAASCHIDLVLEGTRRFSPTFLVIGADVLFAPALGGTLVPSLDTHVLLSTDVLGRLIISETVPPGFPPGIELYFQHWIVDESGPLGFTASNGLMASSLN